MKKPYVRPESVCVVLTLESPICTGSEIQVQAPVGGDGIESQPVDVSFSTNNDFTDKGWE